MLSAGPLGLNASLDFVDAMKSVRDWTGLSGQLVSARDANGWPTSDAQIIVIDDRVNQSWNGPDPKAVAPDISGTYHLSFHGQALVSPPNWNVNFTVQNASYDAASNTTMADLVVSPGNPLLIVNFAGTQNSASPTGAGVSDVKLIRPGYDPATSQVFTTESLNAMRPFGTLRYLDPSGANNYLWYNGSQVATLDWSQRRLPTDSSQADSYHGKVAASWEYMIQLANATNTDMWINVPGPATDDYVTQLASLIKNGDTVGGVYYPGLKPGLKVDLEYSNEVWGGTYQPWAYNTHAASQEVQAGGSALNNDGSTDATVWANRRYLQRTMQITDLFRRVFGPDPSYATIRPVLGWQERNWTYYVNTFPWFESTFGQPKNWFYGLGNANYWGPSDYSSVNAIFRSLAANEEGTYATTQNFTTVATYYGMKNVAYEGGPSLANQGIYGQYALAAMRDPRMEAMVQTHYLDWYAAGGDQANVFNGPFGILTPTIEWPLVEKSQAKKPSLSPRYRGVLDLAAGARQEVTAGVPIFAAAANQFPARTDTLGRDFSLPKSGQDADWLLNVKTGGAYSLSISTNAVSGAEPGQVQVYLNDQAIGGPIFVSASSTIALGSLPLSAGLSTLRLHVVRGTNPSDPPNASRYAWSPIAIFLHAATRAGNAVTWLDDAVPAGATVGSDGGDAWTWGAGATPHSGSVDHRSNLASGEHQHFFTGAASPLSVNAGDTLYAWVYLDPANPPKELMLQWNDGTWSHRAYWGSDLIAWGTSGTASRYRAGILPAAGGWAQLSVPAAAVGLEGRSVRGMAFTLYGGQATWDDAGTLPASGAAAVVWVDDSIPAGATAGADGGDAWSWTAGPTPHSGSLVHASGSAAGEHQHFFANAASPLLVNSGDTLYAWVYLDPANPPKELMLQWNDGTWLHRAYWGSDLIAWGTAGTASRYHAGMLPTAGGWVRLSVSAASVGLEGRSVRGVAFTLYDGQATWDDAGTISG
ncbi:MAG: hypothetical protein JWN86_269 [Planctomycetota bacterium]|nr:hypothetical protein [Planctomycetota bacterium]